MSGQIFFHRIGLFHPDGYAIAPAQMVWTGRPETVAPPPTHLAGIGPVYARPMDDDDPEHWLRLHAEHWVQTTHEPDLVAAGDCRHLRHAGGIAHPHLPHVRLGGALSWAREPHPHVRARMDRVRTWTLEDYIRHFAGPTFPN